MRKGCTDRQLGALAVMANALHEGIGGHIGEQGRAYGPWQLDVDNGLPMQYARMEPYSQDAQDWAWSVAGINTALSVFADNGARGLVHAAEVRAIARILEGDSIDAAELAARVATWRNLRARGEAVWAYLATKAGGPSSPAAPAPVSGTHVQIPRPHRSNAAWHALLHVYARTAPRRCHEVIRIANRLPRARHAKSYNAGALAPLDGTTYGVIVTLDDAEEFNE